MSTYDNQRERRHAMISKISASIQGAVLSVGRSKEDLKKYTLNIEDTAWRSSKGNPEDYERIVNDLVAKLHKSAMQHGHNQQQQQQQQLQQQQYGVQQPGMQGYQLAPGQQQFAGQAVGAMQQQPGGGGAGAALGQSQGMALQAPLLGMQMQMPMQPPPAFPSQQPPGQAPPPFPQQQAPQPLNMNMPIMQQAAVAVHQVPVAGQQGGAAGTQPTQQQMGYGGMQQPGAQQQQPANPHLQHQQSSDQQFQDFLSIMAEPKQGMAAQQQQQQQAFPGSMVGMPQQQQQQMYQQGQQQQPQASGYPGMQAPAGSTAMSQPQQQQQQQPQMVPMQQQQQQAFPGGAFVPGMVPSSGPTSGGGPASNSALANQAAIQAAAKAAQAKSGLFGSIAMPAGAQQPQQQPQQAVPQQLQQQQHMQPQQLQQMQAAAGVAGVPDSGPVSGGLRASNAVQPQPAAAGAPAAPAAAAAVSSDKLVQNVQSKLAAMTPQQRTRYYWEQVAEYERRYAEEIRTLHQRLQSQLAGTTNKDKVQSYLNKTHAILKTLQAPRPADINSAPDVTIEQVQQLLVTKRTAESMLLQLKNARKRPGQPGADPQQQQQAAAALRQQQQQVYGAAATPEEVLSRPPAAPSPLGGPAPSPHAGALAGAAATPPITVADTSYIKPELPPAAVLPAAVQPAAAQPPTGTAGDAGKLSSAAAEAAGAQAAAADTATVARLAAAAMPAFPDTALGRLQRALHTASEAQQQRAAEQQAQALRFVPDYAALGPRPTERDFAAAAATADMGADSDTSVSTVPFSLLQPLPVLSSTLCVRLPEGFEQAADGGSSGGDDGGSSSGDDSKSRSTTSSSRKRKREQAQGAVDAVAQALEGTAKLWLLPEDADDAAPVGVCIECVASREEDAAPGGAARAAVGQRAWKRLKVLLPAGNPQQLQLVHLPGRLMAAADAAAAGGGGSDTVMVEADDAAGGGGAAREGDITQLALAALAWDELLVLLQEQPVLDLAGATALWCAAVRAVQAAQQRQP